MTRGGGRECGRPARGALVTPYAVEALREAGIDWKERRPRDIHDLGSSAWDIVIAVCDRAKEACTIFPGQPGVAHWGMADPEDVEADDETKGRAFRDSTPPSTLCWRFRSKSWSGRPCRSGFGRLERRVDRSRSKLITAPGLAIQRLP